jgi:hypothetical protein
MGKFLRILKKVLIASGIGLVCLICVTLIVTYIFEDKVKAIAIENLNQHLQAEVLINPNDIQFSLLRNFPNASINLSNFKIRESYKESKRYLAQVGRLSLLFSPVDIYRGNYNLKRIVISDADISLRINAQNEDNWNFWKSSEKTETNKSFSLNLNRIVSKNVHISYVDETIGFRTFNQINKAVFSGKFSDAIYELAAEGDLVAEELSNGNLNLIKNKPIQLQTVLLINRNSNLYTIKQSHVRIKEAGFIIQGIVKDNPENMDVDFKVNAEETNIQTLMALLPEEYSKEMSNYKSKGNVIFNATIKGKVGGSFTPLINVNFGFRNAEITRTSTDIILRNLNLKGSYTNGKSKNMTSSSINLTGISGKLNTHPFAGFFSIENLNNPFLNFHLDGTIILNELQKFFEFKNIKSLNGKAIVNVSFKGRISELKAFPNASKSDVAGKLVLFDANALFNNEIGSLQSLTGNFYFNKNNLEIEDFAGKYASTDFRINGQFKNIASWVFLKNEPLEIIAVIQCKNLRVDDFITETSTGNDTSYKFSFPVALTSNLNINIENLEYGKIQASNFTGQIIIENEVAEFKKVQFRTMGGFVQADGTIEQLKNKNLKTGIKAQLTNIDVPLLFYQLDNFGQNYFTDRHIKGKMSSNIIFNCEWLPNLDADLSSISTVADITIDKGEIIEFDPFIQIGKKLKIKSLNDLKFSTLTNNITISNQVIYIPKMELRSSAMNMSVSGTHTFNNVMDYKMKLNISQLLFGKKENYQTEFGEVEVDNKGGMNLYLTINGSGSSPTIAYDKRNSFISLKKGFKEEGKSVKEIFRPQSNPDNKNGENLNKKQEGYSIGFDEDDPTDDLKSNMPDGSSNNKEKRKKAFDDLRNKLNKPQKF